MVLAITEQMAEDLLDITKENAIEIAANAAAIKGNSNIHMKSYSTGIFPKVTQV